MNVMKIMQNKNSSYFLIIILTIVFATSVNAGVLFGQSFDKEKITTNEVAFFNITIYNDNNYEIKDYLRLESSENISFIDSEDKIILQEFGPIKPFEKEVVKIRIKANNTKKNEGIIYGYYGIDPNGEASYAFVGRIGVESKPIFVEGKTEKKLTDTGEIISTDFKMFNSSKEALHNVAFEVSAPNGFEIRTAPIFFETVEAGETITGNFEIYPPIEAIGEQKIILNYDRNFYFVEQYKKIYVV